MMRTLLFFPLLLLFMGHWAGHTARANTVDAEADIVPLGARFATHERNSYFAEGKEENLLASKVFGAFEREFNPIVKALLSRKLSSTTNSHVLTHVMIPMRDGVQLSTFIIHPNPTDGKKRAGIVGRSPYGPTSDQVADLFIALNDFVGVIQDQRGTFLSEGEFSMWQHDAEDGYDTLEWLSKQEWSNGKFYSVGISADGCGAGAMILSQPPQLKGQMLIWSSLDGHATSYPGGAFREGLVTGWMTMMGMLTRGKSLTKTLPSILAHEELSEWWSPIQGAGHYHQANWPTIHVSGWWDIFQGHQLTMFNGIFENSPKKFTHTLVVGPSGHCLLGNLDPMLAIEEARGLVNAMGYASEVFSDFERGREFDAKLGRVNLYLQGSRRSGRRGAGKVGHYWTSLPGWPKSRSHRLYLGTNGILSHEEDFGARVDDNVGVPDERKRRALRNAADDYVEYGYDPRVAAPTVGGNNLILIFLGYGCASEDQRRVERREDVAVFTTTTALEAPLAIVGQVRAELHVSTNRNDTDFFVSLTDVHPDGSSMQIRSGLTRMRWRESNPFQSVRSETIPGNIYKVKVDMWFTGYILAPGHHLRVLVGSANTPYYAKNDNSGEDELGFKYELPARNRIYVSHAHPSFVEIPVVRLEDLPKNENF